MYSNKINQISTFHYILKVHQVEYPLGGSSIKYIYTSYWQLTWYWYSMYCDVRLYYLWHQVTIEASRQHLYQTIVQFDKTIVLPKQFAIGSIHDYLFCYCPLVGYSIWGTETSSNVASILPSIHSSTHISIQSSIHSHE